MSSFKESIERFRYLINILEDALFTARDSFNSIIDDEALEITNELFDLVARSCDNNPPEDCTSVYVGMRDLIREYIIPCLDEPFGQQIILLIIDHQSPHITSLIHESFPDDHGRRGGIANWLARTPSVPEDFIRRVLSVPGMDIKSPCLDSGRSALYYARRKHQDAFIRVHDQLHPDCDC